MFGFKWLCTCILQLSAHSLAPCSHLSPFQIRWLLPPRTHSSYCICDLSGEIIVFDITHILDAEQITLSKHSQCLLSYIKSTSLLQIS